MAVQKERFGLYIFSLLAIVAFLTITIALLQGGLVNYVKIIALVFPFGFMFLLNVRPIWHVLYFGLIASEAMVIPRYGLEKFTPLLMVLGATSIAVVLDTLIHRSPYKVKLNTVDRWVLLLAVMILGRFIYDRPGFVGLGASEGGFTTALTFCAPVWFYFVIRPVIGAAKLTRKQLKFIAVFSVITILWTFTFGQHYEGIYVGRRLTNSPAWLFCAVSLALMATSPSLRLSRQYYYLWIMFFLFIGVFSGYRSRIFFFMAEILMVSFFVGKIKKTCAILIIGGVVGIGGMLMSGNVPEAANRVVSLFGGAAEAGDNLQMGGVYGWTDNFRLRLYQFAWEEIRQSPWVGHGFGLNVREALGILSITTADTEIEMLALGGSYHNSVVSLAVKTGLPVALIFCVIGLVIPIRFINQLRFAPPSDVKTWGIALLAFWAANLCMLLMNGGGREFFAQMIVTGLIAAVSTTKAQELAPKAKGTGDAETQESLPVGRSFRGFAAAGNRVDTNGVGSKNFQ